MNRQWVLAGDTWLAVDDICGFEPYADGQVLVYLSGGHRVYAKCSADELRALIRDSGRS